MSARRAMRRPKAPNAQIKELNGTVGALFAYIASMRPLRGVADVECRDQYQRGRSLIQRLGISAKDEEEPGLSLTPGDCADILYFMHYSEPLEPEGWWKEPEHGPSHCFGWYIVMTAMEKSLRRSGGAA